jgi:hypothetical protein
MVFLMKLAPQLLMLLRSGLYDGNKFGVPFALYLVIIQLEWGRILQKN